MYYLSGAIDAGVQVKDAQAAVDFNPPVHLNSVKFVEFLCGCPQVLRPSHTICAWKPCN